MVSHDLDLRIPLNSCVRRNTSLNLLVEYSFQNLTEKKDHLVSLLRVIKSYNNHLSYYWRRYWNLNSANTLMDLDLLVVVIAHWHRLENEKEPLGY